MKKTTKLFFSGKKWGPNSGFVVAKKAPGLWKKKIEKNILPACLCEYDLQNGVPKFFLSK